MNTFRSCKTRNLTLSFLTLFLTFGLVPFASAGSVLEIDTSDRGQVSSQTAYLDGGKMIMKNPGGENLDVMFDSASNTMTVIQHADRSFMRMNEADMNNMLSQVQGVMSQMQSVLAEQMAGMSQEQKDQMQGMLGGILGNVGGDSEEPQATPQATIKDTGKNMSVSGVGCRVYQSVREGQLEAEMCVAGQKQLGMSDTDYTTVTKMLRFAQTMASKAEDLIASQGISMPGLASMTVDGLPVHVNDIQNNARMSVKSVKQAAVDAALFQIPQDYTQTQMALPGL